MLDMFQAQSKKELRPHQVKAVAQLRASFLAGNKRTVLQLPTGAGKTLTAAKIIESALAKGKRVLFTVPRLSLVNQTVAEFTKEGIPHIGVIQANHPRTDASAPVQVASVQTLARREVPNDFGLVLIDECHETYDILYELMARWPDAYFVGLSATPWAKGMGLHWQDLCNSITLQELIDAGYLSKFVAYAPDVPDLTGIKTVAGDYAENTLADVMADKKLVASVVDTWLLKGEDRPTFCFGVNRAHAGHLRDQFNRQGVSAGYCDAFTDSVEMGLLERRFRAGDIRVMCSVRKMTTGIDWPVSCIIDAAPTQSEMLHVQKIGRGLRVNPGTEDLVILDHASNSLRLGLVTDIRHDKLNTTPKGTKEPAKERLPKPPRECANCAALMTGLVCPFCGHEHKPAVGVETVEGELKVIGGKVKAPTSAEKQAWWSGILSIKAERQKSSGWAAHAYRDRFGAWPRGLAYIPGPASQEVRNFIRAKAIRFAKAQEAKKGAA